MRSFTALFLTLVIALAQMPAQQNLQESTPDTVIRINVNLVQVDAVVLDAKDRPVTDLKKEDFVVLQDGKPQAITNFSLIDTKAGIVRNTGAKAAPPAKGTALPPPPPMATRPKQIRRTIALVVDDLGLSFESIARVRQALKKYVDQEMQPNDLVAIIRTGAGMGSLQQFTSDKRMLYAAIDHVKYNSFGRVGVSSFAPLQAVNQGTPDTTSFDNEREQIFSAGTMGAIQYVVEGLKELPGRKSVILFSENLKLMYNGEQSVRVQDSIKRLGDAANRASVVIYSIDPRGVVYTGLTAADNTSGRSAQQLSEIPMQRSQQVFDSQDGMVILAHETGGLFKQNSNDISGDLTKVMDDGNTYYLLGYHPESSTFDHKTGQAKFHSLAVRVKRPGLHVRYRSGFFGNSDRETAPVPRTRLAQLNHALSSPFGTGALHVRLTSLFSQAEKTGPYVNSMLYFDPRELEFTDEPDDWHKAVVDVVCVTFGEGGQAVDTTDKTWTLRLKGDSFRQVMKQGMVYSVHVAVKQPGAYQMRVVLRDATSEKIGSASQFIDVPDINKGRLALSGIVLRAEVPPPPAAPQPAAGLPAATPPPADQTSASHAAQPNGADHPEGQQSTDIDPEGTPAVRIFKPGSAIVYGYQILNAQADSAKQPELEVQTRLFRDGEQVYAGNPSPLPVSGQNDPKRLIGGGRMKLGGKITPGDYVLQVIVTDKLAKEKFRVATQSMDFEIKPPSTDNAK